LIRFFIINRYFFGVILEKILMLKVNKYLKTGLALSAIVAMSTGLSTGPVYAQEEEDEKEKDAIREVLVDCDQGQSVQKILRKFANDTKPLEITVRGTCDNEPDESGRNSPVCADRWRKACWYWGLSDLGRRDGYKCWAGRDGNRNQPDS
jgi:hypothetical protein